MDWRLADAKNRFSELFTLALTVGPQRVRRRQDAVIVISERDYERLTGQTAELQGAPDRGRVVRRIGPAPVTPAPAWRSRSMKVLLDTCALAELRNPRGHPAVKEAVALLRDDDLYLSALTLGEISKGICPASRRPEEADLECVAQSASRTNLPTASCRWTTKRPILWGEIAARCAGRLA